jgi:hypothetical protein
MHTAASGDSSSAAAPRQALIGGSLQSRSTNGGAMNLCSSFLRQLLIANIACFENRLQCYDKIQLTFVISCCCPASCALSCSSCRSNSACPCFSCSMTSAYCCCMSNASVSWLDAFASCACSCCERRCAGVSCCCAAGHELHGSLLVTRRHFPQVSAVLQWFYMHSRYTDIVNKLPSVH